MAETFAVDIEEVEYLRHGDKPLMARIHRPRGPGPFPAVVEAHGGAWCEGNRANNDTINAAVARGGVVVAALDFRCPPDATYPGSVADINYAIRWLKANAARFNTRPEWIGSMGTSSGGHLIVLDALKPDDPRYAAIPMAGGFDAHVRYVVSLWPVICPIGRYNDRKARPAGEQAYQNRGGAIAHQDRYWLTEAAMAEGSPNLALERGDTVEKPNILYVQNPADELHPRRFMEQFIANYRKQGGQLENILFESKKYDAIRTEPDSDVTRGVIEKMVAFIRRETVGA